MIKVLLFKKGESIIGVEIKGHADFDEYGKDIVCSAVSVLSQTALNGIMKYSTEKVKYRIDEKSGLLSFTVPNTKDEIEKIRYETIMETMKIGLLSIADSYKAYVKLEEKDYDKD